MTTIKLPWPPKDLSPNARVHWSKRSKAAKSYRLACATLTKQAAPKLPESERLVLWITFYPPDKRHRDDDNLIAAFKSGRDGLAEALGINDKRFVCAPSVSLNTGGYVEVHITAFHALQKEAAE